jgi:hypothetical protein
VRVEVVGLGRQAVAAAVAADQLAVGPQGAAQVRQAHVQGLLRAGRRVLAPDGGDELVGADRPAEVHQQIGEDRELLAARDRPRPVRADDLHRTEDAELHRGADSTPR